MVNTFRYIMARLNPLNQQCSLKISMIIALWLLHTINLLITVNISIILVQLTQPISIMILCLLSMDISNWVSFVSKKEKTFILDLFSLLLIYIFYLFIYCHIFT
uniref:Uncharacterized protein n=1 Tax=Salix viminalis TaxID=40686 RepID=A0A6N2KA49_SALVM